MIIDIGNRWQPHMRWVLFRLQNPVLVKQQQQSVNHFLPQVFLRAMGIDVDSRRQQRETTPASSAPLSSLGLKGDNGAMADLVAQLPHVYDSAMQTRQTSAFIAGESIVS